MISTLAPGASFEILDAGERHAQPVIVGFGDVVQQVQGAVGGDQRDIGAAVAIEIGCDRGHAAGSGRQSSRN